MEIHWNHQNFPPLLSHWPFLPQDVFYAGSWQHWHQILFEYGHIFGAENAERRSAWTGHGGFFFFFSLGTSLTGWWFGCHFLHFPIYWEFHHPNWLSYFSEGWPNHQPAKNGVVFFRFYVWFLWIPGWENLPKKWSCFFPLLCLMPGGYVGLWSNSAGGRFDALTQRWNLVSSKVRRIPKVAAFKRYRLWCVPILEQGHVIFLHFPFSRLKPCRILGPNKRGALRFRSIGMS